MAERESLFKIYSQEQLDELNIFRFHRTVEKIDISSRKWKHHDFMYKINCLMCDKHYEIYPKHIMRKFCSNECKIKSRSTEYRGDYMKYAGDYVTCHLKRCNERFYVIQVYLDSNIAGKYCKREHYLEDHKSKAFIIKDTCKRSDCKKQFEYKITPALYERGDRQEYCSRKCVSIDTISQAGYTRCGALKKFIDKNGRTFRLRSSYEIAFIKQFLDKNALSWDYECKRFDLGYTTYTPDFWVKELNTFIETKGYFSDENKEKITAFKKLYPDINLIIATEDILKDTYHIDLSKKIINKILNEYKVKE